MCEDFNTQVNRLQTERKRERKGETEREREAKEIGSTRLYHRPYHRPPLFSNVIERKNISNESEL